MVGEEEVSGSEERDESSQTKLSQAEQRNLSSHHFSKNIYFTTIRSLTCQVHFNSFYNNAIRRTSAGFIKIFLLMHF